MMWRRRLDRLSAFWNWLEVGLGLIVLAYLLYEIFSYGLWLFGGLFLTYQVISILNSTYSAARVG